MNTIMNCLVTKLKAVVDNDNLPIWGAFAVNGDAGNNRPWYFNSDADIKPTAKFENATTTVDGQQVSSITAKTRDGGSFNLTAVDSTKPIKVTIYDVEKWTKLGSVDLTDDIGRFSVCTNLESFIAREYATGDISSLSNLIKLSTLTVGHTRNMKITGNLNDFAESQIRNGRNYLNYPNIKVTGNVLMTYNNGSTIINMEANQVIYIVFTSTGYELRDTTLDGTVLYSSE